MQCNHFQLFTLSTYLDSLHQCINAIVEAAATIVNASAASIMLVDCCQLAAADVTLFLLLASHLGNEIMGQKVEIMKKSKKYDQKVFVMAKASRSIIFQWLYMNF